METTYGLPRYVFPPEKDVIGDLIRFCRETLENGDTPVLFGYSLGKSQEILKALNQSGLPIMMHPQPFEMCETCREFGIVFPQYKIFDEQKQADHVIISPPLSSKSSWLTKIANRKTAMISGWGIDPNATYRYQCDKVFPLSDHSDYLDLVEFVSKVKPTRVLTVHGYAKEFAATLREQGYDAFALGKENQMGLSLAADSSRNRFSRAVQESVEVDTLAPNSFYRFAETCQQIHSSESKHSKIEYIVTYLETLSIDDAAHTVDFFSGRPFGDADAEKLGLGWTLVRQAVLSAAGAKEIDFKTARQGARDGAETAAALLQNLQNSPSRSIPQIKGLFDSLVQAPSPHFRLSFLSEELKKITSLESKYLIKIISGNLDIGLEEGFLEDAIAKVFDKNITQVRAANLRCGTLSSVLKAAAEDHLESITLQPFRPIRFMLAKPESSPDRIASLLGDAVWCEDHYNGIRCQIHKHGERVELFDRDLLSITVQYPEIVEAVREIPQNFVADGQIVAWKNERPLPFSELQKRLHRKGEDLFLGEEIPVILWLYDLLWFNGNETIDLSLENRRKYLDTFTVNARARIAAASLLKDSSEISAARAAALERGNKSIILKNPKSAYYPGSRRDLWIKLKSEPESS